MKRLRSIAVSGAFCLAAACMCFPAITLANEDRAPAGASAAAAEKACLASEHLVVDVAAYEGEGGALGIGADAVEAAALDAATKPTAADDRTAFEDESATDPDAAGGIDAPDAPAGVVDEGAAAGTSALGTYSSVSEESPLAAARDPQNAFEHFHAVITTNKDTYESGETAQVSIRYQVDEGTVQPGDFIVVSIPPAIASGATFLASSQHFSAIDDLGGGLYRLTFGPDAETSLCGSMTVRVTTHADHQATDDISTGDARKAITVTIVEPGSPGTGTYEDETIMKDGLGNNAMTYGGYDYSESYPSQIGLFDSSVDNDFTYRLFINRKNAALTDVVVHDLLPDGMYLANGAESVACYAMDPATMVRTDTVLADATVSVSGQMLTVALGDISYPVEIDYAVHVPAQTSVRLNNQADVSYGQGGSTYFERAGYIAQGNDYSAVNGVKHVDKATVTADPSDQWVTYTLKFWNENGFAAGSINLVDDLDDHVRFLFAEQSDLFSIVVDAVDATVLHITNVKAIPASFEALVSFTCDFTDVPGGYTVLNTVGGNTTRTTKEESEEPPDEPGPPDEPNPPDEPTPPDEPGPPDEPTPPDEPGPSDEPSKPDSPDEPANPEPQAPQPQPQAQPLNPATAEPVDDTHLTETDQPEPSGTSAQPRPATVLPRTGDPLAPALTLAGALAVLALAALALRQHQSVSRKPSAPDRPERTALTQAGTRRGRRCGDLRRRNRSIR